MSSIEIIDKEEIDKEKIDKGVIEKLCEEYFAQVGTVGLKIGTCFTQDILGVIHNRPTPYDYYYDSD